MKGETMEVLTTRTLRYLDEEGNEKEVVLTIFKPFETEHGDWEGGFAFGPPIARSSGKHIRSGGIDPIQAIKGSLTVAGGYLAGSDLRGKAHWQGMPDCGMPRRGERERPASYHPPDVPPPEENPGNLEVLTTRTLACPDEMGVARALLLTIYKPFQAEAETWKCAFALGPTESAPVRYGIGADFIDAFLDALVLARVAYEAMVPDGYVAPEAEELHDCTGFPYKIGRSYWTDPTPPIPGMPDLTPSWLRKST